MGDWKGAMRGVKKELASAKNSGDLHDSVSGKPAAVVASVRKRSTQGEGHAKRESKRLEMPMNIVRQPMVPAASGSRLEPRKIMAPRSVVPQAAKLSVQRKPPEVAPMAVPEVKVHKKVPDVFPMQIHPVLTRRACFKQSDSWVEKGRSTQLNESKAKDQGLDVVIGLDFGTSYTKAAIGLKDQIFVVSWDGTTTCTDTYLLPSEFSIMGNGSCQLGLAPDVSFECIRQRIKHPLINHAVASISLADAAVFVALVLRYIRAWTFLHHGKKIGTSSLRWMLNIGAPSNGLENDRHKHAYLKMASAAWIMSLSEREINPDCAVALIHSWQPESLPQDLYALDVLPEFVAQIAGYVQSPQRKSGLHALVDVGGGTLDVVTFIVHEREGEDVFPFLVPEIKPLGTQMLNYNRLVGAAVSDEIKFPDELMPVLPADRYAQHTGLSVAHIEERDKEFWSEVRKTVGRVLNKTKITRYRQSPAWTEGLPVFLTGGGGSIGGYKESVELGGERLAKSIRLMVLPMHPRLVEFEGDTQVYQRVSVACGLAQDAFSLGELIPAGKIEDDLPSLSSGPDRPDRDELYS